MKYNTWVINLPQRIDRRDRVLSHYPMKELKVFQAIDGKKHILTAKEQTYFNEHFPSHIKGAIGAFLSFYGAYKEIAVSPTEWNFIIGDDNVFHRDFNDIVEQMSIPEDAGMVSVTGTGWRDDKEEDRACSIQDAINRFKDKEDYNIRKITYPETYGIAGFIHRDFARDIVDTFESGFQTFEGQRLGTQVRQDATVGHLVNWWTYWKYHGKWSLYEFDSPLSFDTGMFEEIADSDISIYKKSLGKVYNQPLE